MDHRQLVAALAPAVTGGGTTYLALADTLRALVLDGRLLAGDVLPAERALAAQLGSSRTTVTAALSLLRAEGFLASRQGSGTVVAAPPDVVDRPDEPADGRTGRIDVDLTVAAPSAPALLGPLAFEAAARLPALLGGHGLHPLGLRDLRLAIARRLTRRGLPTTVEQILVTQGALHGWDLLLRAYARPGHLVGIEQPTYPGAVDAARAHALRLLPIGVDELGWSLPRGAEAPSLALVTPDHHNPTGFHASDAHRRGLLRALRGTRIVADETFAELGHDDPTAAVPSRPLAALGTDVVTVGSLSKLVWAGLRIGWIRAPVEVVSRLGSMRGSQDIATPVLDQLLAVAVFDQLDAIRAERVAMLRTRREHLLGEITAAGWTARRPAGGMFLWVDLGDGVSSTRLAASARTQRVRVAPGPRFSQSGTHDRYLRLPFCRPEPVLTDAVTRLLAAAADTRRPAGGTPRWTA